MEFIHQGRFPTDQSDSALRWHINHDPKPVFACGGSLTTEKSSVVVRWDAADGSTHRLGLPSHYAEQVEDLVTACQPATFGLHGKDVLDKSYRDAVKLETEVFSSSFDPNDQGIVLSLAQLLWPDLPPCDGSSSPSESGPSRVRAELYKLNVYSAPSGHFKPHVDTPRDATQFGSLVVCLPSSHKGGDLVVRHTTKSTTFKWGLQSASKVQWAAFYSDCEHEVMPVTSGHRITLTYNLFHVTRSKGVDSSTLQLGLPDPQSLQLFDVVSTLLAQETYLPHGGTVGVHLSHFYAHSTDKCTLHIPTSTLKGIDLAIYYVFMKMKFGRDVRSVLLLDDIPDRWEDEYSSVVEETDSSYEGYATLVRKRFEPPAQTGELGPGNEKWPEVVRHLADCADCWKEHVHWLNDWQHCEMAISYLARGNLAEMDTTYSSAALLIEIPAYEERAGMLAALLRPQPQPTAGDLASREEERTQPLASGEQVEIPAGGGVHSEQGNDSASEDMARGRKRSRSF